MNLGLSLLIYSHALGKEKSAGAKKLHIPYDVRRRPDAKAQYKPSKPAQFDGPKLCRTKAVKN